MERIRTTVKGVFERPHASGEDSVFTVMFRIDKRQTSETFDTFEAAVEFKGLVDQVGGAAAKRIRDTRDGQGQVTRVPALRTFFADWNETRTDVTDGTMAEDARLAERSWMATFGDWPIDTIDRDEIKRWVNKRKQARTRRGTPIASKTIKNEHGLLSTVLGAAVPKWRPDNPARGIGIPEDVREEMVFLTQAEFYIVLSRVPAYWKPLILTLAGTGMRWGEVTALRWKNVNLELRVPTVSIVQAWKKGATTRVIGTPKTKKSRRTISLPPQVVEALESLDRGKPDDFVFRGPRGGRVHHQNFHPRVWTPALAAANTAKVGPDGEDVPGSSIDKHPRIHDLRHSHASWLIASGTDIYKVSRRLGHESIQTTIDTYGHLLPDHLEVTANAADVALRQAVELVPTQAAITAGDDLRPATEDEAVDAVIVEDDED